MQAKDIMRKRVITVTPDMTLLEVSKLFADRRITGAPVVGPEGNLLGVISETDLTRHQRDASPEEVPVYHQEPEDYVRARGFHFEVPDSAKVEEVMTPRVISLEETASIRDIANTMLTRHIHRVIITREGRLRGIVTTMDMLKATIDLIDKTEATASR